MTNCHIINTKFSTNNVIYNFLISSYSYLYVCLNPTIIIPFHAFNINYMKENQPS
ncbi:hypothetical protein Hanom_Chr09g00840281 [Helianthus anomalus]